MIIIYIFLVIIITALISDEIRFHKKLNDFENRLKDIEDKLD